MIHRTSHLLALLLTAAAACSSPAEPVFSSATYEVVVSGETFFVKVDGAERVKVFETRLATGGQGVINGRLRDGTGGFNEGWSWHLDPATVEAVDVTIELCDGRPSMIEENRDYWFESVGQFCPWGARVVARVQAES